MCLRFGGRSLFTNRRPLECVLTSALSVRRYDLIHQPEKIAFVRTIQARCNSDECWNTTSSCDGFTFLSNWLRRHTKCMNWFVFSWIDSPFYRSDHSNWVMHVVCIRILIVCVEYRYYENVRFCKELLATI